MAEPLDFCAAKLAQQDRADMAALLAVEPLLSEDDAHASYVLLRDLTAFERWAYGASESGYAVGWLLNECRAECHLVRALLRLPTSAVIPADPVVALDLMGLSKRVDLAEASLSRRWSSAGEGSAA